MKTFLAALGCWVVFATFASDAARAQTLNYSTTWIGNSFGGGEKWVQNEINGMYVAPDGTVYTASNWDEGGHEFGIYKNGEVVGAMRETHGWGTGGGFAITANDKYVFIAHVQGNEGGGLKGEKYPPAGIEWYGVSRRTKKGDPAPFEGGRGRFNDLLILNEVAPQGEAQTRGLAIYENRLYVSDGLKNEIKVFDVETLRLVASWKVEKPRQIAFDARGNLWVLQGGDKPALQAFSRAGKTLPQRIAFEKGVVPSALCFAPDGRLLVTDNGAAQRVLVYNRTDTQPRLVANFGEKGGIYAPPVAGRVGAMRLVGPTGIGVDTKGNLYIGGAQPASGAILRAFAPSGKTWKTLKWQLLGLEFVDGADAAPDSDGTDIFTTENRYRADWSKPVGQQWTWRAQTVNPFRFPNDPRLNESHHDFAGALVRKLGGKTFLVVRGMFEHALMIYQMQGETAVPSAMFAHSPYRNGTWKNIAQPDAAYIWRDKNGDGDFQPAEFGETAAGKDPGSWAWWMDESGGVWKGLQNADDAPQPILYFPLQGFDKFGNPIYTRASMKTFAFPAPLNELLRLEYSSVDDTMYLTGFTPERPKNRGEWGQVGSEVWRIDGWIKGNRTPRYRIALPYQKESAEKKPIAIKSFCVADDAIFAVESRTAKVHVYDAKSGNKLGEMMPGTEVSGQSGWIDIPDAIRAVRRKNGEYLVFVEEDWKGKIIVYRWKPDFTKTAQTAAKNAAS